MSLRSFHLLFVVLTIALLAVCAAWTAAQYEARPGPAHAAAAAIWLVAAAALGRYAQVFRRRTQNL